MKTDKTELVVLNIVSWEGISKGAEHFYGKIILIDHDEITIDNIEEFQVSTFGRSTELLKTLTGKECYQLDKKDGGETYSRRFMKGDAATNRFNTMQEITDVAIEYYKDLNLDVPFISLREGKKFDGTVIIKSKQ